MCLKRHMKNWWEYKNNVIAVYDLYLNHVIVLSWYILLTGDITCWSFLEKEYFVTLLFTDTFIISVLLTFNMCSWHGISFPIQINVRYLGFLAEPYFHTGINLPHSQAEFSHPVLLCLYIFSTNIKAILSMSFSWDFRLGGGGHYLILDVIFLSILKISVCWQRY